MVCFEVGNRVDEGLGETTTLACFLAGGFLASDWSTGSLGLLAHKSFELIRRDKNSSELSQVSSLKFSLRNIFCDYDG